MPVYDSPCDLRSYVLRSFIVSTYIPGEYTLTGPSYMLSGYLPLVPALTVPGTTAVLRGPVVVVSDDASQVCGRGMRRSLRPTF